MGTAIPLGPTSAPGCDEPTSRAKHRRRYELLGGISLLSPEYFYPLSDGPSIQNHRITMTCFAPARAVTLAVKLAYAIALTPDVRPGLANLRAPPLLFRRSRPSQTTHQTLSATRITGQR